MSLDYWISFFQWNDDNEMLYNISFWFHIASKVSKKSVFLDFLGSVCSTYFQLFKSAVFTASPWFLVTRHQFNQGDLLSAMLLSFIR